MQVLLIYNLIPDSSSYYAIQPDASDLKRLDNIHGLTMNGDEFTEEQTEDWSRIQDYLGEQFFATIDQPIQPEYFGKWAQHKLSMNQLAAGDTHFYRVYVTEFLQ